MRSAWMRSGWVRLAWLGCIAVCAGGCGHGSVPEELRAKMQAQFDEMMIERDPLCIEAGPFPYRTGETRGNCDRCQELEQAGLLSRRIVDDASGGFVEYALSHEGEAVYRLKPDAAYLDILRARFAGQGQPDHVLDLEALARPRMCFGLTRFNRVADALSPMTIGGSTYTSVKLVAAAVDTSKLLFDPRMAKLGLPIPPQPEPGKPALYPPQVMTFQIFPADGSIEISDMRYGAWVNEP